MTSVCDECVWRVCVKCEWRVCAKSVCDECVEYTTSVDDKCWIMFVESPFLQKPSVKFINLFEILLITSDFLIG
jgi:hypothetical protein